MVKIPLSEAIVGVSFLAAVLINKTTQARSETALTEKMAAASKYSSLVLVLIL